MLKEQVLDTIKKYNLIEKNDKLVVAVSGGPDSISLLHILLDIKDEYNLEINVAHVNHMIRENASLDEAYVKEFCEKNNINFFVKRADVLNIAKQEKIGTEEAGRKIRYEFFDEVQKQTNANKIAIAHNKNDNAETVILNLMRGSGSKGLVGIEPKAGKYIRPLVKSERKDIEKYCSDNNLNPRIDESNAENIYNRNKVRNIILPFIEKEFNPNIVNTIDRLSDIVKENEEYIEKITENEYKKLLIEQNEKCIELNLKEFNKTDLVIRKRIVFYCVKILFGTTKGIEKIHIDDIIKLCDNNIGNKFLKPNKNIRVSLKNKQLYFERLN